MQDEVGRGGMGVVFRARDLELGRKVAVKILLPKYAPNSPAAARFVDEARITAQLQHPGIPPVYRVGSLSDGRPFLAMRLIRGHTLAELLTGGGPNSPGRWLGVFESICQAVGYAHARRVIHRDLKPANVMVGSFGEVQVMDWGLAKVLPPSPPGGRGAGGEGVQDPEATATAGTGIRSLRDADLLTQYGSILGTPAYMAPEQAVGAVEYIDRRTDVFGLGAILCALLTGKPPFVGDTAESTRLLAARAKLDDAFTRLESCGAEPDLVALAKRCLSADPADRPADASEVAAAVATLRAAADERARKAELDRVKAEGQRRQARLRLTLASAVGLLLFAAGGFVWYWDRQTAAERDRRAQTAGGVAALLDQAEAALRAADAGRAGVALDAADRRAADGGVEGVADRLAGLQVDLAALRAADAADQYRWSVAANRHPTAGEITTRYTAVLAVCGADPDATPPADAAARISRSTVRDRLVAALDHILWETWSPKVRDVLRAADPDPLRDVVRNSLVVGDRKAFLEQAQRPDAADQPPAFVAKLGDSFAVVPLPRRRELLAAAIRRRPGDLRLLLEMADTYPRGSRQATAERLRWCQAAVAVAPDKPVTHNVLGHAHFDADEFDAALACFREAVRLDPTFAYAHTNTGNALSRKGDLTGAASAHRQAVRLDPALALAHANLGAVLRDLGELDEAVVCLREAARLQPGFSDARRALGSVLKRKGEVGEAVAAYREAVRLDAKNSYAHSDLGVVLMDSGDPDGAIACFDRAIALDPKYWIPHHNKGQAQEAKGDFDAAAASYRTAVTCDPSVKPPAKRLARVERLRALRPRLSAVLAGSDRPATADEAAGFAELCSHPSQKRYAAAVRLYEQAFAADPALADGHRHQAATAAARAGRPDGADIPDQPTGRAALRAKALVWLRADLTLRQKQAGASAAERGEAITNVSYWLRDPALAGTRPGLWRIDMSPAERAEWDAFWADVRRAISAPKPAPTPPPG